MAQDYSKLFKQLKEKYLKEGMDEQTATAALMTAARPRSVVFYPKQNVFHCGDRSNLPQIKLSVVRNKVGYDGALWTG